jgi:predicted dehydrogenase
METRREFIKTMATAAAVASASRPIQGANDRIRMAVIGTGTRGQMDTRFFMSHPDCEFVAACDVRKTRLDQAMKAIGGSVQGYGDYRRILERKDIDAVLVTTPDHWHGPIVAQACAAGKDAYVEKPMTHTIEDALMAVEAAKKYKRVVQLGVQQRSGAHFQECAKMIQDGYIGKVSHCVLNQPGSYGGVMQPTAPVPEDLDWEMFQGPAPRHPFSPSYLRWRAFYMYGGGLMTDWGVHLTDIALLAMRADGKAPIHTAASAQYVGFPRDPEQFPDVFTAAWQYDDFLMTFTNIQLPSTEFPTNGNYFYGTRGVLHVNRSGYRILPQPQRGGMPPRAAGAQGAGARAGGARAAAAPAAPQTPPAPIEAKTYRQDENYEDDPHTKAHARNFLDCVKSRKSPAADITGPGFYVTLPCLLGRLAVKEGKAYGWDGTKAVPV